MSENDQSHNYELDSNLNPIEPEAKVEARKKIKRKSRENIEDLQKILETEHGRRFVWRYLGLCGVFEASMRADEWIYFNEGKRSIGLLLLQEIMKADKTKYLLMAEESEHNKRGKKEQHGKNS